jgi:hypothetical protein
MLDETRPVTYTRLHKEAFMVSTTRLEMDCTERHSPELPRTPFEHNSDSLVALEVSKRVSTTMFLQNADVALASGLPGLSGLCEFPV